MVKILQAMGIKVLKGKSRSRCCPSFSSFFFFFFFFNCYVCAGEYV